MLPTRNWPCSTRRALRRSDWLLGNQQYGSEAGQGQSWLIVAEIRLIVLAAIVDAKDVDHLVHNLESDRDPPAIAQGPHPRANIVAASPSDRKSGQALAIIHDGIHKARRAKGCPRLGNVKFQVVKLVQS